MPKHRVKEYNWYADIFILFLFILGFFALFLGNYHLLNPDEARYSEIASEMFSSGQYLTPHMDGIVFLDKPILFYWLEIIILKLFGLHDWSMRLMPVLVGVLGCVMSYVAGRALFNRRVGILAALILATTPLYYGLAHYVNMDMEVAVFLSCALYSFIIGLETHASFKRSIWLWLAYFFAALAFLTKGLIGIVFPFLIIGTWVLLLNRWHLLCKMRLISGLVLFLMVIAPWFLLEQHTIPNFFQYFFVNQQFSRYLTNDFNCHQPFYFYFYVLILGGLPWTVFLGQTIWHYSKLIWKDRDQYSVHLFLLLWAGIILLFFSTPKSKLVGYLVPAFVPLALLISVYLDAHWQQAISRINKISILIWAFLSIILCAVLFYVPGHVHVFIADAHINLILAALIMLFGAVLGTFYIIKSDLKKVVVVFMLTSFLFFVNGLHTFSKLNLQTTKPLDQLLLPRLSANDMVVAYYDYLHDLPFYLQHKVSVVQDWNLLKNYSSDDWKHKFLLGLQFNGTDKKIFLTNEQLHKVWSSNKRVYVFINAERFGQFKNMIGSNYAIIARYHNEFMLAKSPKLATGKSK